MSFACQSDKRCEHPLKDCAAVPPKRTVVVPVKPKPLMDTEVPVVPLVGLNDVISVRFNGGGII